MEKQRGERDSQSTSTLLGLGGFGILHYSLFLNYKRFPRNVMD